MIVFFIICENIAIKDLKTNLKIKLVLIVFKNYTNSNSIPSLY